MPCLYGQTSGVSQTDNLQLALQRGHKAQTPYLNTTLRKTASGIRVPVLSLCSNMQKQTASADIYMCADNDYTFIYVYNYTFSMEIYVLSFIEYCIPVGSLLKSLC